MQPKEEFDEQTRKLLGIDKLIEWCKRENISIAISSDRVIVTPLKPAKDKKTPDTK